MSLHNIIIEKSDMIHHNYYMLMNLVDFADEGLEREGLPNVKLVLPKMEGLFGVNTMSLIMVS